jgi:hypothetical protein
MWLQHEEATEVASFFALPNMAVYTQLGGRIGCQLRNDIIAGLKMEGFSGTTN